MKKIELTDEQLTSAFQDMQLWSTRFYHYSINNSMLIWIGSNGNATFVAPYNQWQKWGYQVQKGETGLPIYVPMVVDDREYIKVDGTHPKKVMFKVGYVFDWTQTDAPPPMAELPETDLNGVLTADDPLYLAAQKIEEELLIKGWTFDKAAPNPTRHGSCSFMNKVITIFADPMTVAESYILIHEAAHALTSQVVTPEQLEGFTHGDHEAISTMTGTRIAALAGHNVASQELGYFQEYASNVSWLSSPLTLPLPEIATISDKIKRIFEQTGAVLCGQPSQYPS